MTGYPETCAPGTEGVTCATSDHIYNYDFTGRLTLPNTHDVGLLVLDQPIALPEYGQLAEVGTLTNLATARGTRATVFTVSGYGLTYKPNANAPLSTISFRERLMVLAYIVGERTREIGIRMALGAAAVDVLRMVMRQSGTIVALGIALGLAGALAIGPLLAAGLYGVTAHDGLTLVAVPLLIATIAAIATWVPARRAARVDPVEALRDE